MDLDALLLEQFRPGELEPSFGTEHLRRFGKAGASLSELELERYVLDGDLKLNGSNFGQRFKHKYFDTTFNFCLTYRQVLVASLGFELDDREMTIWQIQGIKGQGAALRPIKWERALVQYAVVWATEVGAREIWIPSVEHVHWAAHGEHLDPVRGRLRYDVTARRCGFRANGQGYYVRAIEAPCPESAGEAP